MEGMREERSLAYSPHWCTFFNTEEPSRCMATCVSEVQRQSDTMQPLSSLTSS